MKRRAVLLTLVLTFCLGVLQSLARAEAQAKQHTVLPEGVTEIDLRACLGDEAGWVAEAWVLRKDVYALLLTADEPLSFEVLVLDTQTGALLSRTPVPYIHYPFVSARPGWVNGALHIMIWAWDEAETEDTYSGRVYIQVRISPDGTVEVSDIAQSWDILMPGGKTAIREMKDGSLYAVDVATGTEELLIQGVSKEEFYSRAPDEESKYVPVPAEISVTEGGTAIRDYDVYDPNDNLCGIRDFGYVTPLDDHRFAYGIRAWEWEQGFGVYDLKTRMDHRITMRGTFLGKAGGSLISSTLKADADTYETSPMPEAPQSTLDYLYAIENDYLTYSISPDGRRIALTGKDHYGSLDIGHTVTITDMETGEIIRTYDIRNPYAEESSVDFYDDTRLMLFCSAGSSNPEMLEVPWEERSAYIYLIDIEK